VNTLAVDTTKAFKDIKGIKGEPYTIWEILRIVLPIILILGLIGFGIYAYRRYKANKPIFNMFTKPLPSADVEAISSLNELKDKNLWQNNAIKSYYSELTNIMRRYIERRYDFPAQEMVSSEIIGSLSNEDLSKDLVEKTEEILQTSDLVKFAKYEPLGNVNDAAIKWAYNFVNSTKEITQDKEAEK